MFHQRYKRLRHIASGADRRGTEMFRRYLFPLGVLVILMGAAPANEVRLERKVLGAGGKKAISAERRVRHSLGQPVTGLGQNPEIIVRHGFWKKSRMVSGVESPNPLQPLTYRLDQNHPNPFNPRTTITFSTAKEGRVELSVYDIRGRRVDTLMDEARPAGEHSLVYSPTELPSGVYFYKLRAPGFEQVRRLVLVR